MYTLIQKHLLQAIVPANNNPIPVVPPPVVPPPAVPPPAVPPPAVPYHHSLCLICPACLIFYQVVNQLNKIKVCC